MLEGKQADSSSNGMKYTPPIDAKGGNYAQAEAGILGLLRKFTGYLTLRPKHDKGINNAVVP